MKSKIYLILMIGSFVAMGVILNALPRSSYSELERRELNEFPKFSMEKLRSGEYTKAVSSWYSDTEPFRDKFMETSMKLRKMRALHIGEDEDQVTYIASNDDSQPADAEMGAADEFVSAGDTVDLMNANAKIANHGIIIVGKAPNARALMAYQGRGGGETYASVINTYKETFGSKVNVYCMVVPSASQFYRPEKAKNAAVDQRSTMDNLYGHLRDDVRKVWLLDELDKHKAENIYLRTDHHWSPLGAFYAARELCKVAKVHVPSISEFEQHVVHGFVGTMYGFSQDISIKNSPEDFVYYTPKDVQYTTTYITYDIDKSYRVVGEHKPHTGAFFHHFKDGSSSAYCTFMGGDTKITQVVTSTKNGRRLIILKDSYGNALPGYLFKSFEEIHVIDGRYFTKNMVDYVREHRITDIVFANNIFKAYAGGKQYLRFLTQKNGTMAPRTSETADTTTVKPKEVMENKNEESSQNETISEEPSTVESNKEEN